MRKLFSILLFALWPHIGVAQVGLPFPGPGGIAGPLIGVPVSLGCALGVAGASSISLTTTAAIPAASMVFVGVQVGFAAAQTITGVSDGTNTYSNAVTSVWDSTAGNLTGLWHKPNAAAVGSSATLTATFSAASVAATNVSVICAAYSTGILPNTPLDKSANAKTEPGTAFASGSTGTLSKGNELVVGFVGSFQNCTSVTEGSGFNTITGSPKLQGSGNNWCGNLAYAIVGTTTAVNYQPILTSSFGAAVIATFKGF